MTNYSKSLFIFRRDLRINDNTALNLALKLSKTVVPCFVFDPVQINKHAYQSVPGLQFMLSSIKSLQQQLQQLGSELNCYYGNPELLIKKLYQSQNIDAVFLNRDYSPFSRKRDHAIFQCCQLLNIQFHYVSDALINDPEQVLKPDGNAYKVFTPFYNKAKSVPVPLPQPLETGKFCSALDKKLQYDFNQLIDKKSHFMSLGGSEQALKILNDLQQYEGYQQQRDFPALNATSRLSAHLKFGTCSVRQVYYAIASQLNTEHPLIKQLYWRDFFTHIGFHYPKVFGHAFHEKYDAIPWSKDLDLFQAWATGKTGFPIVDAGMRELNQTGFMHNRVRMITASFLVKDLHISWRWGERYFAQHLIDYDPCVNNGNWQWAASTGCDAQPYFRIFNPWLQQQKFDANCDYIHQWIPELKAIDTTIIHKWEKKHFTCAYPAPIVDHKIQSTKAKEMFKSC